MIVRGLKIVMTLTCSREIRNTFQTVDLSEEYKEKIVDYMFKEYEEENSNLMFYVTAK
jgi:tRNA U34 2-thiouridine synthase MnmA/TrmU